MNESTWLASNDPAAMLEFLLGHNANLAEGIGGGKPISDRKLRLFVCAVARALGLVDEIEAAERLVENGPAFAMSSASLMLSSDARHAARMYCYQATGSAIAIRTCPPAQRAALLREIVGNPFRPVVLPLDVLGKCRICNGRGWLSNTSESPTASPIWSCSCQSGQRPVACSWLTPTVVGIARQAYDERPGRTCPKCNGVGGYYEIGPNTFHQECTLCHGDKRIEDGTLCPDTLGVLADCLEDAGCDNETMLQHLRGYERCWGCSLPGAEESGWCAVCDRHTTEVCWLPLRWPHVRGDWVLDLIFGQE